MRTLPKTDKQLNSYLSIGKDIPINDFLLLKQPRLEKIMIDIDYDNYMDLINIMLVGKDVLEEEVDWD